MFKKFSLVLFLAAFSASVSYSQNLSLGLKAGGGLVNMTFNGPSPYSQTHFGFSFGAATIYKFSQILSFEGDLLYSRKGTKQSDKGIEIQELRFNDEYIYSLSYISIPLIAKLYLPVEGAFKPHAEIGAALNFLVKNELEFNNDPNNPYGVRHITTDMTSKTNSFDLGLLFGLGADYQLTSGGRLSLEARYERGLTDLDKGIGSGPVKNSTLSLIAGYSIMF